MSSTVLEVLCTAELLEKAEMDGTKNAYTLQNTSSEAQDSGETTEIN